MVSGFKIDIEHWKWIFVDFVYNIGCDLPDPHTANFFRPE